MLRTLRLLIIVVAMLAGLYPAMAGAMSCQQLFMETAKDVTIDRLDNPDALSELNLHPISFEATEPQAVARETRDVVMMMSQSRSLIISDKDVNEKGRLRLGVPIGNGFSIELKYQSHSVSEVRYVLDHLDVLSPTGKIVMSSNPIDMVDVRKLARNRTNYELEAFGEGYNINAKIPTVISGGVLREIQLLSPKLELVPKEVIRELAKEPTLARLKKKANRAYMKYYIKRYVVRGIFKTGFKIALWPLKGAALAGILYMSAHMFNGNSMMNAIRPLQPTNTEWVYKSIQESVAAEGIPAPVKHQLSQLEADLRSTTDTAADQVTEGIALDQNAAKFQVTKDQYLWTTTIIDKESGQSRTIIFVSTDNMQGEVKYTAIAVDPVKYKQLVGYLKTTGQFVPVTAADLK